MGSDRNVHVCFPGKESLIHIKAQDMVSFMG